MLQRHGIHRVDIAARGSRYFCAGPVRLARSTAQSQAQQPHTGISVTIRTPKTTAPWGCRTDRKGKGGRRALQRVRRVSLTSLAVTFMADHAKDVQDE